jgi:hypothetical protein
VKWPVAGLVLPLLAPAGPVGAEERATTCFDLEQKVDAPLRPPIPLLPGRDHSLHGTYPNGVHWASGRAVLEMPIRTAYERLLDHRNVKDMRKTTLSTTRVESPAYLERHLVEVVVTVRVLLRKVKVAWTEAWAYSLVEGTAEEPRRIVISYQKTAGTRHIRRLCGSYVLAARDDGTTDLALYDEVKASRRSAEDTRDMHAGILRNLRAPAPQDRGSSSTE